MQPIFPDDSLNAGILPTLRNMAFTSTRSDRNVTPRCEVLRNCRVLKNEIGSVRIRFGLVRTAKRRLGPRFKGRFLRGERVEIIASVFDKRGEHWREFLLRKLDHA